jgi:hypothetical protein
MRDFAMRALHQWTVAWFVLCVVLALHIYQEVTAGAHQTYGATMDLLRQFFPVLPPFNYTVWLFDITGAALALLALTWLVHKRNKFMLPASYALATFTTANAMLHLCSRLYGVAYLAGTESALLLLAASLFLLLSIPSRDTLDKAAPTGTLRPRA